MKETFYTAIYLPVVLIELDTVEEISSIHKELTLGLGKHLPRIRRGNKSQHSCLFRARSAGSCSFSKTTSLNSWNEEKIMLVVCSTVEV